MHSKACYVLRRVAFETPAEIRMFQHIGGDVVGMTNVPEVTLARKQASGLPLSDCNHWAGISSAS